jgi:RNA polymerase sigma-B factor
MKTTLPMDVKQTHPSEAWLLRRYQRHGDTAARDELVRRLMPLVRSVALRYSRRGRGDDLEQVAALGLVKAIDRYDPTFGTSLRNYAMPTMSGEIRRYLRDHTWMVRPPRRLQEGALAVTAAIDRLATSSGRAPTPQQVADDLGCDVQEVLDAMLAGQAYSGMSLDAPANGNDERGIAETLGEDDERLARVEQRVALRSLRNLLDDRDRHVFHLRFVEERTQDEIASVIGISQMQVSRLLRRCIARLSERVAPPEASEAA